MTTQENIEKAINLLMNKMMDGANLKSEDAMRFSQSALNLAHTKATLVLHGPVFVERLPKKDRQVF